MRKELTENYYFGKYLTFQYSCWLCFYCFPLSLFFWFLIRGVDACHNPIIIGIVLRSPYWLCYHCWKLFVHKQILLGKLAPKLYSISFQHIIGLETIVWAGGIAQIVPERRILTLKSENGALSIGVSRVRSPTGVQSKICQMLDWRWISFLAGKKSFPLTCFILWWL